MSDLYRKIPRDRIRCFVIGNFNELDMKFDIYFWYYDEIKMSETYERYVIAYKLRMSYGEEERFNKLCHTRNIITDNWTFEKLYKNIHKNHEEIHLKKYENNLQTLHHLYHSWQTGIEELFYKAELGFLAFHLDDIEEYNLIGSTPAQILEFPIGVLRCLNSEQGITALKTHHRRIFLRELYRKYPDMFKHEWTVPQCKYYVYVICEKNAYTRFDVKAIRYMSNFYKEIDFWEYISYLEKRSLLSSIVVIKEDMKIIPALHDGDMVQELYFKTDYLYHMLLQDRDIYEHFLKNQYLLNKKYEYEDEHPIRELPGKERKKNLSNKYCNNQKQNF